MVNAPVMRPEMLQSQDVSIVDEEKGTPTIREEGIVGKVGGGGVKRTIRDLFVCP
jgi:hypothetical protein